MVATQARRRVRRLGAVGAICTTLVAGSLKTKAQGLANKVLPDSLKAKAHRQMAEPQE